MKAKILVYALPALILATIHFAEAQQPKKIPRVGFVVGVRDSDPRFEAFRQGLRDLGYNEGKDILLEYRPAEQKERSRSQFAELLKLKIDLYVSGNLPAIQAAKEATRTIPIVIVTQADPVSNGLIDSLARPGGNITGLTTISRELSGKRLELVKEVVPDISRVGVLWDENSQGGNIGFKEYEAAARGLKISLQSLEVRGQSSDFDAAFQAAAKGRVGRNHSD
jgi:putative tryptophan/tyrosine transport system substrate-binding protein